MSRTFSLNRTFAFAALVGLSACGGDSGSTEELSIQVHGPNDGQPDSSTIGFPVEVDACVETLRFSAFQGDELIDQVEARWNEASVRLPKLRFGEENWISVEGLSGGASGCGDFGDVVASGATTRFTFDEDGDIPELVAMTGIPERFTSAWYFRRGGDEEQSTSLIYELEGQQRAGHTLTALPDGSGYVVIGGAKMTSEAGLLNSGITSMVDTIEFYDAYTGEFLTFYESGCSGAPVECALRLPEGTAFHAAEAFDDGSILITGGLVATGTLTEIAPTANSYVLEITGRAEGELHRVQDNSLERAFHTATRMPDGRIVIMGGILGSYDASGYQAIVEEALPGAPDQIELLNSGVQLGNPRALHTATYFDASGFGHGIIVVGGRNRDGVVGTSEVVFVNGEGLSAPLAIDTFSGNNSTNDLQVPRFGHSAAVFSCPGSDEEFLAIAGGYTVAGAEMLQGSDPTAVVETYIPSAFPTDGLYAWSPDTVDLAGGGRAFGSAVGLPISGDLMYLGGIGADGAVVSTADRVYNDWNTCELVSPIVVGGGGMGTARAHTPAVALGNGFVFTTGGFDGSNSLESSEFYNPNDYSLAVQ